jgi:pimeloyl-ACP methyl ester carboxylesterase
MTTDVSPRLVPVAPDAAPPVPRDERTAIDAPATWRRRAGADPTRWEIRSLSWTPADVPADPPVVLVHGLAVGAPMCRPVAERLAHHQHVHVPELPGFGASDKPRPVLEVPELADALAAWMDARGLTGAVVAGVSVGSQVAADLALRHPERVALLALVSPTVDASRRTWPTQLMRWQLEQGTQSLAMRRKMLAGWVRSGVVRGLRTFGAFLADRPEDKVALLEQPVLVCWGTRDPLASRGWAEQLAAAAPHGELAGLPGAVHAMTNDDPDQLARVLTHAVDQHHRGA